MLFSWSGLGGFLFQYLFKEEISDCPLLAIPSFFAAGRIKGANAQRILFVKRKFDPAGSSANRGTTFTIAYLLP
ncbi:MAG: hypothetical protein CMI26_06065 [Opitutae bacterium]|nr:hypothetical protein [Opitutae bacterium]